MQTKNVNLIQTNGMIENQQVMAFRSSLRGCSHEPHPPSSQGGSLLPPPSAVYLPLPPSTKQKALHEASDGYPLPNPPTSGAIEALPPPEVPKSSAYQPPPLPPRVGSTMGKTHHHSPVKEWVPREQQLGTSTGNATCGPYKPVPPPKPFAGSPVLPSHHHHHQQQPQQQQQQQYQQSQHHQQRQQMEGNGSAHAQHNGHSGYPHILVTDQGHFVTHSAKFPIEENEKLVKMLKEANSTLKGIDNPALVAETQMGVESAQAHLKDSSPNHYAPMRAYDPSKALGFMPNGHAPQGYPRPSNLIHSYHPVETSWQNHAPNNSVRFTAPPVNQSPDKTSYMNGMAINGQSAGDRPFYHASQHASNSSTRGGCTFEQGKPPPHFQDPSTNSNDANFPQGYTAMNHHGQSNGASMTGVHNGVRFMTANGDISKPNSSKQEVNGVLQSNENAEGESKKEENRWGSLKRAGKKYSHLKNIFSGKFTKSDATGNPDTTHNSTSTSQSQSRGTNSQDRGKNPADGEATGETFTSERLHNGENHSDENSKNFQRVVTYSSLKTRLEGPPPQTLDSAIFTNGERQSGKAVRNLNNNFPFQCSYANQIPNGIKHGQTGVPKRSGSCTHLGVPVPEQADHAPSTWGMLYRSDDNLTRPLASDQSYPERSSIKPKEGANVHFLPTREGRASGGGSDSGRGTGGGSATEFKGHDTSLESGSSNRVPLHGHSSGNESEWIDIPETEGKHSLYRGVLQNGMKYPDGARTPPLPPLSPEGSPNTGARLPSKSKKQSNSFSSRGTKKPDIVQTTEQNGVKVSSGHAQAGENINQSNEVRLMNLPPSSKGSWMQRNSSNNEVTVSGKDHGGLSAPQSRFPDQNRHREEWQTFNTGKHLIEDDELTSTDAALDLNSVLDGVTEASTDDELASNRDDDAYLIRRQLEGLEGMYSEVLKVLGGRRNLRHNDPRLLRRRTHGSVSSLPSSVMSNRASKDRKAKVLDDRLRRATKDVPKNTHKRFQRLESHVVTLARSVAHLSSEMRTQHLMLQEIESIRNDISSLKLNIKANSGTQVRGGTLRGSRLWNGINSGGPPFSTPGRVKKLTQFFGDEPPLVRIFLRKLGYEKYAPVFEKEKIGMLELPYMTEDRLQKIGIPLGPRLRILEEARGPITTDGNLSVYVV